MWEDKRVRQVNMWGRIFLKVRYNKQPGKKKMLVFYYHRERNYKHIQEHNCILLLVQAKTQDPACPFSPAAGPNKCVRQAVNGAYNLCSSLGRSLSFSVLKYQMGFDD